MNFWRRLAQNRLLDVGAGLVALIGAVKIAQALPAGSRANDFAHYYVSGLLLSANQNPYCISLEEVYLRAGMNPDAKLLHVTDPPALLRLTAPLASLPPRLAFSIWVALEVACLGSVLGLSWRLLGSRMHGRGFYFLCCGTICSSPVLGHFIWSQVQMLLAVLLLGSYAAHRAGREWISGAGVAAAVSLKLFPFVLVPWFVWRGRDGRCGQVRRAVYIAALLVGGVLVTGSDLWQQFLADGLPYIRVFAARHLDSFSLPSFLAKVIVWVRPRPYGSSSSGDFTAAVAISLLVVALAYTQCLRRAASANWETEFSSLVTVMVMSSLVAWGHYLVLLIFPMAVLAVRLAADPKQWEILRYVLVLVCLNSHTVWAVPWLSGHPVWKLVFSYLPLYGMVGLAAWIIALSDRELHDAVK